jgi:hypothetical protein
VCNCCANQGCAVVVDMCANVGGPLGTGRLAVRKAKSVNPSRARAALTRNGHSRIALRGASLLRSILFVIAGGLAGFLYSRFVGCKSGYCPLTSNQYVATVYGAVLGLLLGQS